MNQEYNFINEIINKYNYKNGLEIGMNYGLVSYYILLNNSIKLLSIDDEQKIKYDNFGINLLKNTNLIKNHKFINNKILLELPKLVESKKIFDFIYIDVNVNEIFDNIYIIIYYALILLNVGGTIIFNNSLKNK
jgi:hypothetical protein